MRHGSIVLQNYSTLQNALDEMKLGHVMSMQPKKMEWPLEWKTLAHFLVLSIVLCIRAIVNQSASQEYQWGKAIGIAFEIT